MTLRSVVSSLKYLHQNGIVHRNISTERIFVNSQGMIKLDYFGHFCEQRNETDSNYLIYGNISYVAPELLQENSEGYNV